MRNRAYVTTKVCIDGQSVIANIMDKHEFIRTFLELETLIRSDDKKYWILYEERFPETPEYYEVFWCCPASEVNFIDKDSEWIIETEWNIETEEIRNNRIAYEEDLQEFDEFIHAYGLYIMDDLRADTDSFEFYKAIQSWVKTPADEDIRDDNKACVVSFLREHWKAWYESVLNREYKYMNVSGLVHDCWECL